MKRTNASTTIGTTLLVTLALSIGYLMLPKVHTARAASTATARPGAPTSAAVHRARVAHGQLPVSFELNQGQFDPQVRFASRGAGYKAFLTATEQVFVLRKPQAVGAANTAARKNVLDTAKSSGASAAAIDQVRQALQRGAAAERAAAKAVVRVSLVGANSASDVIGLEELPGKINYFRGNDPSKWLRDVPTFARVRYTGVYPGIDLVYYGVGRDLEYDLVVAPGADPRQIAFQFDGAERVEVDPMTAELVVHAAGGAQLRQGRPVIYQEANGAKRPVAGGFHVNGGKVGFSVGNYDAAKPLVIDPVIFSYSTYLGGEEDDRAHDVAVDAERNAYVVGTTDSEEFPLVNAYQTSISGQEAFVTKFDPEGGALIWSTYLGGTSNPSGDGGEFSCCDIFPFPGCEFGTPPFCFPADFVSATDFAWPGSSDGDDGAFGVAVDPDGNVYVTGITSSRNFPTRDPMQPHISQADGDDDDADSFITKLNAAGNQLVFSTYFGGMSGTDVGRGIAVDSSRNVYVAGYTDSYAFPTTNPIQPQIDGRSTKDSETPGNYDAYLAKIDASGQFRIYSTFLGGDQRDVALDVAVDGNGSAYVTGWTESTFVAASPAPTPDPSATPEPSPVNFPTSEGAFQETPAGNTGSVRDAFVTKVRMNTAGQPEIEYSTFLGGTDEDVGWGIATGADGTAYVTGYTESAATPTPDPSASPTPDPSATPVTGFPTRNAFQGENNGGYDAFLTRLNAAGSDLVYSTYLGGDQNEGDGGVECLDCASGYDGGAVAIDYVGNAYITGWTESTFAPATPTPAPDPSASPGPINFPTKDAAQPSPGTSPGASSNSRDAFAAKFNTNATGGDSLVYSTFIGGPESDEGQGIAVDLATSAYVTGFTGQPCDVCDIFGPCFNPILCAPPGLSASAAGTAAVVAAFPTTPDAFQEEAIGGEDAFLVKISGGGFLATPDGTGGGDGSGLIISGRVTRADGTTGVAGVIITLTASEFTTRTTTTNADGLYFFEDVPGSEAGITYTVTPSGGDAGDVYTPPSRTVVVTNDNERADFIAAPAPSPSPSPSASPSASPSPSPIGPQPVNLSTRFYVQPDDRIGIGGFIITGTGPKHVIIRAIGPSLSRFGLVDVLPDPVLEVRDLNGQLIAGVATNDNWRDTQEAQIQASGLPPTNDLESAIDATLTPGNYTALVSGKPGTQPTGLALVEVYDIDQAAASKLGNLSTRAFVGTDDNIVIAGVTLGNADGSTRLVFRGLGPSLSDDGVPEVLQDPSLELRNGEGVLLISNNDWQDNPAQAAELTASGLAPEDPREAAIAATLTPGRYTALLTGLDRTVGNGIVEIYDRGPESAASPSPSPAPAK